MLSSLKFIRDNEGRLIPPPKPFEGETLNQVPEQYREGFADFMKNNPKYRIGGQAMSSVMLPDGNRIMFGDTGSAGGFREFLKGFGGGSGITTLPDGTPYNPGRPIPTPEQGGLTLAGMAQQPVQNPFGGGLTLAGMTQQPVQQPIQQPMQNPLGGGLSSLNQQPFGGGLSSLNQQPQQMDGGLKGLLDNYLNDYLDNYFKQAFNQR